MDRRLYEIGEAERYVRDGINEIINRLIFTLTMLEENDFITDVNEIDQLIKKATEIQDGVYDLREITDE